MNETSDESRKTPAPDFILIIYLCYVNYFSSNYQGRNIHFNAYLPKESYSITLSYNKSGNNTVLL
jgi:hypothetical protein